MERLLCCFRLFAVFCVSCRETNAFRSRKQRPLTLSNTHLHEAWGDIPFPKKRELYFPLWFCMFCVFFFKFLSSVIFFGLVVRVPGFRSRGPGSIPFATRISVK
jgi:hypothetical protein